MKKLLFGIVAVVTLTLAYVSVRLIFSYYEMAGETASLQSRLETLMTDSANLKSDLEYFKDPANLEKELRSKFNYKNPGEKLVIGVLQSDLPATTTAGQ